MGDPSRRSRRDRHDLEAEPIDQAGHFLTDIPSRGDDHRLRHGAGRDQKIVVRFERSDEENLATFSSISDQKELAA